MVVDEVAVLIVLVRRHRRAVGAAVRRAVSLNQLQRTSFWLYKTRIWHMGTNRVDQNLAVENRGIFKWHFTTKVKAERKKKCSTPTKSTILNNFDSWYAEHGPCPGALLAFFGA